MKKNLALIIIILLAGFTFFWRIWNIPNTLENFWTLVYFDVFIFTIFLILFRKKIPLLHFDVSIKTAWLTIGLLTLIYTFWMGRLSLYQFWSFSNHAPWDLAIWNNAIYNTVKGYHFFATTIYHYPFLQNIFGEHTHFFMVFLLPFYIFYPRPETLLVLQTLALASGAIPLFLLGKKLLKNNLVSLGLSFIYLIFPYLGLINLSDFRVEIFCIPVLLWVIKFFEDNNFKWFLIFSFLAMSIQENIPLVILMFGFVAIIYRRNWKWILVPITLGVFFFVLDILITKFFQQNPHPVTAYNPWDQYNQYGNNFGEMFRFFVDNPKLTWETLIAPAKIEKYKQILRPLGYLPLLAPQTLLPAIPTIIKDNLLDPIKRDFTQITLIYYISPMVPFLFWGLVKIFSWIKVSFWVLILIIFLIIFNFHGAIIGNKDSFNEKTIVFKSFQIESNDRELWQTVSLIPHSARVAAMGDLRFFTSFRGVKSIRKLDLEFIPQEIEDVDYVLIFLPSYDNLKNAQVKKVLSSDQWKKIIENQLLLFRKIN